MPWTEQKFWTSHLKPCLLAGFRVETGTLDGVPDVFGVLPSGRPVWIEQKITSMNGKDMLDHLRNGQVVFRKDYGDYIPCLVLAVSETTKQKRIIVDVYGQRLVVVGNLLDKWRKLTEQIVAAIDKELDDHERNTKRSRQRAGTTDSPQG